MKIVTIAGDGSIGSKDGPASSASFVEPAAVSVAPDGSIYVADAGAQRIRRIAKDGIVSTVAGSGEINPETLFVRGGFRNGPGPQALFNHPSGIALLGSDLIVADTWNHCLRLIHDGEVSTFAGKCSESGHVDGEKAEVRFKFPKQLAVAGDVLYVADFGGGLRKVGADGSATTITKVSQEAQGVAANGNDLYASDKNGIVHLYIDDATRFKRFTTTPALGLQNPYLIDALPSFGKPYSIAAFPGNVLAFSDIDANAVRLLSDSVLIPLGLPRSLDPSLEDGGFQDGSAADARFFDPLGIAKLNDATLVVADGGNRRIRTITLGSESVQPLNDQLRGLDRLADDTTKDKIVIVGNSFVWFNNDYHSSIGKRLQDDLQSAGRTSHVFTLRFRDATGTALSSYAQAFLLNGEASTVLFTVDRDAITSTYLENKAIDSQPASYWKPRFRADVAELSATMKQHGVKFVLLLWPDPTTLGINDGRFIEDAGLDQLPYLFHAEVLDALKGSGIAQCDLWPTYLREISLNQRHPLFVADDTHPTAYARGVIARAVSACLK